MSDSRANARAVVLAGTINVADVEATEKSARTGSAIYRVAQRGRTPLDLNAEQFRYFALGLTDAIPLPAAGEGSLCRGSHRRRGRS